YCRQLYPSVVEYALCVWYSPVFPTGSGGRKGSVGVLTQLCKVQNIAWRLITGAFKTTPVAALKYLANIPQIELRLNQTSFNAPGRLASLPPHDLLHPLVRRCINSYTLNTTAPYCTRCSMLSLRLLTLKRSTPLH
ncbi:hypothetical protein R3P38DRAFT_2587012, partial [Favolaschia claudopus]